MRSVAPHKSAKMGIGSPIIVTQLREALPHASLSCVLFLKKCRKNAKNALQIFPVRCFIFKQLFLMFKKEERGQ